MSISISKILKSTVNQSFTAFSSILAKAKAHAAAEGKSEDDFLNARLTDDMHPMIWQVQMISEFAVRGANRLAGMTTEEMENWPFEETSFDELIARLKKAMELVNAVDDAAIDAGQSKTITLPIGPEQSIDLSGEDYLLRMFLPNLQFHMTTAYALLRKDGVEIGKLDFLGGA